MKRIQLADAEYRVLLAIVDAIQFGEDPRAAAQRAQEKNHDVEPVAADSEEETAIWDAIYDGFDRVRNPV